MSKLHWTQTPEARARASRRMRAHWKKKKATAPVTPPPLANNHARLAVRVISSPDGTTVISRYEVDSWGAVVDLVHETYLGIPIEEVLVQVRHV